MCCFVQSAKNFVSRRLTSWPPVLDQVTDDGCADGMSLDVMTDSWNLYLGIYPFYGFTIGWYSILLTSRKFISTPSLSKPKFLSTLLCTL